ncbi:MAG: NAD-dependent epimerase/dehydratase family protein [Nanoarchaeota archaeon]
MKTALVLGAGGFIGSHLVKKLKRDGYWVRGVDLKYPEYSKTEADEFIIGDLTNQYIVSKVLWLSDDPFDEVYQLAADMGGAGYIFTGENDANVMYNSAQINLNVAHHAMMYKIRKLFYSSSACVYPEHNQLNPENPVCSEKSVFPANPDSEYGWEKLFSERLYLAFNRNHGLNVRIARFHNIFGSEGAWNNGKEKAPAALCRKVAMAKDGEEIEIWGTGNQTRSFLYIDECLEGIERLMNSCYTTVVNIGSEEMISINNLVKMIIGISGKNISIKNLYGSEFIEKYGHKCPVGVMGRTSDNQLIYSMLNWKPTGLLQKGMGKLYSWIKSQV